uniref:Uncharacterized protein n=1 Tax=Sinocyclocheilus rhinocerous TaxID=307959 RepID=A0A673HZF7_9TELE
LLMVKIRDQDLGSTGGPPRNWKGIGIAMVVILGVMSLVTLSIFLLTPDESHLLLLSRLTLENLESEDFRVHDPCATPLPLCILHFHFVLTLHLHRAVFTSPFKQSKNDPEPYEFVPCSVSNACEVIVQSCSILVRVFLCTYFREITDLTPSEEDTSVLQYAAWGPQGNQLVSVFENDIYYKPDVFSKAMRLTATGRNGMVVNGLSDWTYEEEILLKYPAFWWAKDGARLAYLSINNSATPFMEIHHFLGGIYPSNFLYPYPKAGSRIPSASLFVVNLYGPAHTLEMIPPDSHNSRDSYISMVSWISSTRLTVRWLNRAQNQSVLCVCEATTGACSERHQMAMDFWHNNQQQEEPLFTADASLFYLILPAKQGARGEFLHIASLPAQTSTPSVSPRFLTSGNWDVTSLCALDEENDKMYDRSNLMSKPFHLESLKTLGGVFHRQCLTCNLFERCSFFKADFSPNQTYFTLYCLGPGVPKVTIHSTSDPSSNLQLQSSDISFLLSSQGFGGYLGLKMLTATDQMFKCAAVMAPITDFKLYNANMLFFLQAASLLDDIHKLKDENFLLIHGTADARVHFQHSAELLSRLVKVEANYTLQLYPDEGHSLREERSNQHLYFDSILGFFFFFFRLQPSMFPERPGR